MSELGEPCNGVCRSCMQPVIWVTMLSGDPQDWKRTPTPINPGLEPGGNVEIRRNGERRLFAKVTGKDEEQSKYISHFATCPQAGSWRERKSK